VNFSNPIESLKNFPIINKIDVITNPEKFISSKYSIDQLIKYETSGSSGVRSVVYIDKKEESILRAILINWWEWCGFYLGKSIFQTGMTTNRGIVKTIKDFLLATTYMNAFELSEDSILAKLKSNSKKKNMHLGGFASSLFVMAEVAKKNNLNIKFDAVISWGDKLFDYYKSTIEEVFNTKVYENYGCNEGLMIGQKKDLPYFYLYTPNVFLELLDDESSPVDDGSIGRVIITKLDGYAMPLVRYDTGDLAIILPKDQYPSQRDMAFPLLKQVVGRNTDIIKTSNGINLIVHTFTGIFEFFPEILQFQIIHDKIDSIIIKYIPSRQFYLAVLKLIEEKITEKTGSCISIIWQEVSVIPRSKSGKPEILINQLIKSSLTQYN